MAVTRINNNQISDASAGNAYVGINAATKVQPYSITATKLANNLTYGSDLTVTGNLTVQGNTTAIDTTYTTIEDPILLLASNQTGSPTVDIGFVGQRGTSDNIAFVWDESADEFVTVYTTTGESNTVVSIASYANLHTGNSNVGGNLVVNGTTSFVGNVIGNVSLAGNITIGNVLTGGQVSAAGNVTGGNVLTGGLVSATGNITSAANIAGGNVLATTIVSGASHIGSIVSVSANITGGNILTGGLISSTGNITSAANIGSGNLLATTGVRAATGYFTGNVDVLGNLNASVGIVYANSGIFYGDAVTGNSAIFAGIPGFTPLGSNVVAQFAGNANAYSQLNFQNINTGTSASTDFIATADNGSDTTYYIDVGINSSNFNDQVNYAGFGPNDSYVHNHGGNLILNPETSGKSIKFMVGGTGNAQVVANITATGYTSGGTISAVGNITSAANIAGGNLLATTIVSGASHIGSIVSVSANITGGNVLTGGLISATGNITSAANISGGNLLATTTVSAASVIGTTTSMSGNITGGNVLTGGLISATGNITSAANIAGANVIATTIVSGASVLGTIVSASANVTGGNINTGGIVSATGNITSAANVAGSNLIATTAVVTPTVIGTTVTVSSTGGLITLAPSSNVSVNSKNINSVADPVQAQDAATKAYVDNAVSTQIAYHAPVTAATTVTLETATGGTITYAQPNGAGNGVGATLTVAGGTFNLIDTANIQTANTRVLVKNQANSALNGVYIWSNATVLTRSNDADTYGPDSSTDLSINDYFFVQSGNVNAGSAWVVNAPTGTITFGTSNITFAQFSSSQTYTANTSAGISITGTVISAKVDNNTTAFDGGGNIIVKASANLTTPNIGAATGTSLSVTGNLTGAGGNISGNITGGNLLTGGLINATGNISSAGNITASYYFGNGSQLTGVNASTSGFPVTAGTSNIAAATNGNIGITIGGTSNVLTIASTGTFITGVASASGNVTAGNVLTAGLISATGNITSAANIAGGNLLATTIVSGASHIGSVVSASANITGGNVLTGGLISSTGNITSAANIAGANLIASANLVAVGAAISGNITGGNLLTAGLISSTGNITSSGNIQGGNLIATTALVVPSLNVSGNITGGNLLTAGLVSATGNVSGANVIATANLIAVGAAISGNITGGNLLTAGLVSATGNITSAANVASGNLIATTIVSGASVLGTIVSASGNIIGANLNTGGTNGLTLNASTINSNAARISVNSAASDVDFAVSGTTANVFYVDAGTNTVSIGNSTQTTNAILAMNATNSFLMPVGNTAQRPATGVTGMLRFNSTLDVVEVYDSDSWATVGTPSFTVVGDQQFSGDGSNVAFTLSDATTTNSTIVSINGIVQVPTIAYSVGGAGANVLTFTEAPETGDLIDVRALTTTTHVTFISNSPGNAIVAVSPTTAQVNITGDLSLSNIINSGANGTGNIGNSTTYFNTVFALSTTAANADLAEVYAADAEYEPGTVLSFGGLAEVTISTVASDSRIAGVVSTNPSYVMNATLNSDYTAVVALTGRVPTKVSGTVNKGDMMVSDGNGRAVACATPAIGTVIGKALEIHTGGDGVIEVVVGRL